MSDGLGRRRVLQLGLMAGLVGACKSGEPNAAAVPSSTAPVSSASPSPHSAPIPWAVAAGPATEIAHGSRSVRLVALTFHGAGDPKLAEAVLVEAEKADVHVTVLAVGSWLAANPGLAGRILDGGHELGNHTWSHPALARLSESAAQAEIERCAALLRKLTGSQQIWFRPSGTPHATRTILQAAGKAGYAHTLSYDIDSLDYTDPGVARIVANVARTQPGSVVSMHLGHSGTVEALPAVLEHLNAAKLTPVTVSQMLKQT